ncbi:MAG: DUF445 family protein [Bacteroidetes bacterium]|nr:DUF445 family protein [Bacteroidota bacterium]
MPPTPPRSHPFAASGPVPGSPGDGAGPGAAAQASGPGQRPSPPLIDRERARTMKRVLLRYLKRHRPQPEAPPPAPPPPPRRDGSYAWVLPLLRAIPLVLAAAFLFSFWWDFDGRTLPIAGWTFPLEGLLRIVAVSGLIGFFTNWLAITMLFRPRQRRPLLGQGLVPAQRDRIAYRLAQAVATDLLSEDVIKEKIRASGMIPRYRALAFTVVRDVAADPDFRHDVKRLTSNYAEDLLRRADVQERITQFTIEQMHEYAGDGLGGLALRTYRFLNENDFRRRIEQAVQELPRTLDSALDGLDNILDRLPEALDERSEQIEEIATQAVLAFVEQLDVYSMVLDKLRGYDERELEDLLWRTTNEQLNYIKYLGSVLGCLGGLVIWQPVFALLVFAVVAALVIGADEALLRTRRSVPSGA